MTTTTLETVQKCHAGGCSEQLGRRWLLAVAPLRHGPCREILCLGLDPWSRIGMEIRIMARLDLRTANDSRRTSDDGPIVTCCHICLFTFILNIGSPTFIFHSVLRSWSLPSIPESPDTISAYTTMRSLPFLVPALSSNALAAAISEISILPSRRLWRSFNWEKAITTSRRSTSTRDKEARLELHGR